MRLAQRIRVLERRAGYDDPRYRDPAARAEREARVGELRGEAQQLDLVRDAIVAVVDRADAAGAVSREELERVRRAAVVLLGELE